MMAGLLVMTTNVEQTNRLSYNTTFNAPTQASFDFDAWAAQVKQQMIMSLQKRGARSV
ncbi:MAG TPA: hypothetical protein V6C88_05010 [Chroococcidiopsis sp.]